MFRDIGVGVIIVVEAKENGACAHGARRERFRAIVFHPSTPILIADDDRHYQEASIGASRLLGLPRESIIGRFYRLR